MDSESVHGYFGLSYANYLVIPRTLMQSMPDEWQNRMVRCLEELNIAFRHIEQAEAYEVIPGTDGYLTELSEAELRELGYCIDWSNDVATYYDRLGNEIEHADVYHVIVPKADPVPHYNRGRTYIEPRL
jgi:hypothetical protein